MGKLLRRKSREETKRIERERRVAIVKAATNSFVHMPYDEVKLDTIGLRAGLAQGIGSLYYGSREELFLKVLRNALEPWFDEMDVELRASNEPLEPSRLAHDVVASLMRRPELVRLVAVLRIAMEHNVETVPAIELVTWVRDRATALGDVMEQRCPALAPGGGARFLLELQVVVAGLPRMEDLSAMFSAAVQDAAPGAHGADHAALLESFAVRLLQGPMSRG